MTTGTREVSAGTREVSAGTREVVSTGTREVSVVLNSETLLWWQHPLQVTSLEVHLSGRIQVLTPRVTCNTPELIPHQYLGWSLSDTGDLNIIITVWILTLELATLLHEKFSFCCGQVWTNSTCSELYFYSDMWTNLWHVLYSSGKPETNLSWHLINTSAVTWKVAGWQWEGCW